MGLLDWFTGGTDTSSKNSAQTTTQQLQADQFTKQTDTKQNTETAQQEDATHNQTSTTAQTGVQSNKTAQQAATTSASTAATTGATSTKGAQDTTGKSATTTTGTTSSASATTGASNTNFQKSTLDDASLKVLQDALASAGSNPDVFNILTNSAGDANNLIDFSKVLQDRSATAESTINNQTNAQLALSKNEFENTTLPGVSNFAESVGSRNNSDSLMALTKAKTDFAVKQDAIRTEGAVQARTLADQETQQAFSALLQSAQFKELLSTDATKALTLLGDALKGATEVGATGTTSSSNTSTTGTSSQASDTISSTSEKSASDSTSKSVTDQIAQQIQNVLSSSDTASSSTSTTALTDILSQLTKGTTISTGLEVAQGEEAAGQNGTSYTYGEQSGHESGNIVKLLSSFGGGN